MTRYGSGRETVPLTVPQIVELKSSLVNTLTNELDITGRGERIRTFDPLHPMQVRYQAAPRPDCANYNKGNLCNSGGAQEFKD